MCASMNLNGRRQRQQLKILMGSALILQNLKRKSCAKSVYDKYITPVSQKNSGTVCKPDVLF